MVLDTDKPVIAAEDLAELEIDDDNSDDDKAADDKQVEDKAAVEKQEPKVEDPVKKDGTAEKEEKKSSWPDDWRELAAKHYAAGNEKAYKKELARLQRITDPSGLYGMYRELEGKFTSGGLVKLPGKDAKPEDIAAFHKALGVPEKPEDYLNEIKLEKGVVIGDADKPMLSSVLDTVHKAGGTPQVVNAIVNWYYSQQEENAAKLDEADDAFRHEAMAALKEEYGSSFRRKTSAIAPLFAQAPGGTDIKNENSLFARLLGGRTADGKIIGNDPDIVRFLVGLAQEINPSATVTEDGDQSGKSVNDEIAEIEKIMRTDRREYDRKYANRYLELLQVRDKIQTRQRA